MWKTSASRGRSPPFMGSATHGAWSGTWRAQGVGPGVPGGVHGMARSTVEPGHGDELPASAGTRPFWEAVAQGTVDMAVRIYEALAASQRDVVLEESSRASASARVTLVSVLRRARDFAGAARVLEVDGAAAEVAQLHEQAGALLPAAEAWLRADEPARAAAAFERGGALERALSLYESLRAREAMARCLTRLRRPMEAAAVYRELGNPHAELESLRAVSPDIAVARREAVLRMSALLDAQGESWRALVLLADALQEPELRGDIALQAEHTRLLRHLNLNGGPSVEPARAPPLPPPPPDGYEYLKAIPLFGELSLVDMKDLYQLARPVQFARGATVLAKGAPGSGLLVLLEGTVDVLVGPEPGARLLNTLGPGAFIGEVSLILDGDTSAQVCARTDVRALRVTRVDFQHYLDTHEAAALRILRLFTEKLAERVRALSA
ncbi:cyclic nucleotide-binding domain-containing protein [Myxococcus xanthus]|uniref:Cyclic nucleotide-binding domain-containing protein n=2 Tax=Myxococcus xanthus TaxID=34 RepID=A0A7Y4IDY2_MYXXA|nr:cyclic nucleotide-binding domain-containing protein [Myxococcus xanthus]NOJ77498.1 cyclic nucleotide-binding domain-containing protein [Myxococcus xanthus]NOJ84719.1 cyclic nucleotide-binding domain-containing protein [Myxococcus xanthus]